MRDQYTPCGGCGATKPEERCINCHHDFGGRNGGAGYYPRNPSPQPLPPTLKAPDRDASGATTQKDDTK